jgi:hypothetical protein
MAGEVNFTRPPSLIERLLRIRVPGRQEQVDAAVEEMSQGRPDPATQRRQANAPAPQPKAAETDRQAFEREMAAREQEMAQLRAKYLKSLRGE